MGEPASAVRSLSRRVKPSGIRRAEWRNPPPPSDTPQMVGDGMAGRPGMVIGEIGLGVTEFMPLEGQRTAQDEVRAPVVYVRTAQRLSRTSIQTASERTVPRAINLNSGETASSVIPLRRQAMIKAPNRTPSTLPRPPRKLTPPITQAAIASNSIRSPMVVVEAPA